MRCRYCVSVGTRAPAKPAPNQLPASSFAISAAVKSLTAQGARSGKTSSASVVLLQGGVVHDDQHAVLGELDVVLHPVDTQVVGRVHGGQGVLRGVGGSAPVGVDHRAVVGARGLGLGGGQQDAGAEQGG